MSYGSPPPPPAPAMTLLASLSPLPSPPVIHASFTFPTSAYVLRALNAEIWGYVAESVLYGIFVVLWVYTLVILLDRRRKVVGQRVNRLMIVCAFALFGTTTAHWITGAIRIHQVFSATTQGLLVAATFLGRAGGAMNTARWGFILMSGIVLDAVLVYRVYVLFGQSFKASAFPGLFLVGTTVTGAVMLQSLSRITLVTDAYDRPLHEWIVASFSLTLVTNFIACSMILYKTIEVHRALAFWGGSRALLPIVLIILESSALYSAFVIMDLAGFLAQNLVTVYATDLTPAICGISFTSIVVRVARSDPKPFLPSTLPPLSPAGRPRASNSSSDFASALPSADPRYPDPWARRGSVPWLEPLPLSDHGRRASAPPAWFSEPMPVSSPTSTGWFSGVPGAGPAGDSRAMLLGPRRSSLAPLTPLAPPPPVAIRFPDALHASDARQRTRTKSTATAVSDGDEPAFKPDVDAASGDAVPMRVFAAAGT